VEQAKILVSSGQDAQLDLTYIEPDLTATLSVVQLAQILDQMVAKIVDTAAYCVTLSGLAHNQLDSIYLTGGSSALYPLRRALQARFSGAKLVSGDLFGAVASGLAYST
jgi:hypothetical chaperone protein